MEVSEGRILKEGREEGYGKKEGRKDMEGSEGRILKEGRKEGV